MEPNKGINLMNLGEPLTDQLKVWDQVIEQVWNKVNTQVWDQVNYQVMNKVYKQVREQVNYQVFDQLWDQ